jgi:uncharacterized alpha-E superfamily protein
MDNLFWLGRYAERTESMVRILRAVTARLGEGSALELTRMLLVPFSQATDVPIPVGLLPDEAALTAELQVLIYGRRQVRSLQRLLSRVESTAWSVRDRLSTDTWRTIHALTDREGLPNENSRFDAAGARFYMDTLVRRAAALAGLASENMTRGPNWLFLDLGRRIERASHLAWLVQQAAYEVAEHETDHIRMVLEIADSAMTYRSRYLGALQIVPFVDLLLLDGANPRSAAFQLAAIENNLRELPRITLAQRNDAAGMIASDARRTIAEASPTRLALLEDGKRPALGELIEAIRADVGLLSDAIADAYFQHASRSRTGAAKKSAG